jgi:hypothetical protein
MTITTLIAHACAFLNRKPEDLVVNGVNIAVEAANEVKKRAQRMLDFELLRCSVRMTIPAGKSVNVRTGSFTPTHDETIVTSTVKINRIERAYLLLDSDQGAEVTTGSLQPIDFYLRNTIAAREQRFFDERVAAAILSDSDSPEFRTSYKILVRNGDQIYLWPSQDTDTDVVLDVVRWAEDYTHDSEVVFTNINSGGEGPLPLGDATTPVDYTFESCGIYNNQTLFKVDFDDAGVHAFLYYDTDDERWKIGEHPGETLTYWQLSETGAGALFGGFAWEAVGFYLGGYTALTQAAFTETYGDGDFFLEDCPDWLRLAVLKELSVFIKQDERYAISQRQVDEAWITVGNWNNSIAESGSAQSYDLD